MHALLDIVRERSGRRLGKEDMAHGYAVVFPPRLRGLAAPHADKAIIISRSTSHDGAAIEAAYKAWTDGPNAAKPLGPTQYQCS